MNELSPQSGQQLDLVSPHRIDQALRKEPMVLKRDMNVIVIGFMSGSLAHERSNDLAGGLDRGEFNLAASFMVTDVEKIKDGKDFAVVGKDLTRELLITRENPLAVFIIASGQAAESPSFNAMDAALREFRNRLRRTDTFVYRVIFGGWFSKEGPEDPNGRFSQADTRAHELGGVHLNYNGDYPSVSIRKLVEFVNRVMGADLSGEEFPDYSEEDIRKIAWHIKREDFNMLSAREGAIPKYPIVNGRPQFPF